MTLRAIKMRVHFGRLEPLEELTLPEGTELTAVVTLPDAEPVAKRAFTFPKWDLGVKEPLTRREIYEDVG